MTRRLIILGALIVFLFGFVFLRGPIPHIVIKPETLTSVGGVDLTNTMITSWLVVLTMIVLVVLTTRRWELVPTGVQNVVETVLEAFYNLVVNVAGEKNGRRFFPVVATIFFFVLASNWLSLLPVFNVVGKVQEEEHGFVMQETSVGPFDVTYTKFSQVPTDWSSPTIDEDDEGAHQAYEQAVAEGKVVGELLPFLRGPNTDINTPLALAIISAIAVETWAIRSLGLFGYGSKFFNFGGVFRGLFKLNFGLFFKGVIDAFVGILEFISELVRLVSFTFRLFGNMFAGEVVILMFIFLAPGVLPIILYVLELFVGVIQAFIFAMLTLVFGMMAVAHGEHAEGHGTEEKHAAGEATPHSDIEAVQTPV